jgi:hypothetical protein
VRVRIGVGRLPRSRRVVPRWVAGMDKVAGADTLASAIDWTAILIVELQ